MTRRNLDVADLTKNIFDYANTDYKNPDFSNTTFFQNFKILYFDILEWTYISSAYQFHQESKKQLEM